MSYMRKPVRQSMGGVENCGADQVWDPNIEYLGIKGQCMPRKNYTTAQLENPNAFPTSVKSTSAPASSSTSPITAFFQALTAPASVPAAAAPVYYPAPASSGPSTTTLLLIGGGALALLFLATR